MPQNDEEYILLHLLNFPKLAEHARKAEGDGVVLFAELKDPHCVAIWTRYKLCADRMQTLAVPKRAQFREYVSLFDSWSKPMPGQARKRYMAFLKEFSDTLRKDLSEEVGRTYLNGRIEAELSRQIINRLAERPTLRQLDASMSQLRNRADKLLQADLSLENSGLMQPFAMLPKFLGNQPKLSYGVDFLDEATYGGQCPGDFVVILGPTGGGKTMLTIRMLYAQMMQGTHSLWLTYEQSLDGDLSERLVASATDIRLPDVRQKEYGELSEKARHRIEEVQRMFGRYLHVRDFSKSLTDSNGIELDAKYQRVGTAKDIIELIELLEKRGTKIQFLVLDWLGEMVVQIAAATNQDPVKDFQKIAMAELKILRQYCKRAGIVLIVLHQIKGALINRPPVVKPSSNDGEYWANVGKNADNCFAMGNMKGSCVFWFCGGKNRKGQRIDQKLYLDGDRVRFKIVNHYVYGPNGDFIDPNEPPPDVMNEGSENINRTRAEVNDAYVKEELHF